MSGFVKLDCGITESSLWHDRDARSLFLTALVMAGPFVLDAAMEQLEVRELKPTGWMVPPGRYGFVRVSGAALIKRDGIEEEKGWRALEALCAPDPDSRSNAFDGRRLARIDGGYVVLNHAPYRDKDYSAADRARRYRDRRKAGATAESSRDDRDDGVRQRDTYASASASDCESASEKQRQEDSIQGERPGVTNLGSFLTAHDFGRFKDQVVGYIRASRSSTAVLAMFEMHLAGEMGHEKATPEQLGLALQHYAAAGHEQFNAMLFAGFIRKAKAMPERAERRRASAAEDSHIVEEQRQREQREREDRDQQLLVDFARRSEERYMGLKQQAEASIDKRHTGETRANMVRGALIALVRKETR